MRDFSPFLLSLSFHSNLPLPFNFAHVLVSQRKLIPFFLYIASWWWHGDRETEKNGQKPWVSENVSDKETTELEKNSNKRGCRQHQDWSKEMMMRLFWVTPWLEGQRWYRGMTHSIPFSWNTLRSWRTTKEQNHVHLCSSRGLMCPPYQSTRVVYYMISRTSPKLEKRRAVSKIP